MTHDQLMELEGQAWTAAERGHFEVAGQQYTAAAYASLGTSDIDSLAGVSSGLVLLLRATLCYRLGEYKERAAYRARCGVLLAEELDACRVEDPIERGIVSEYLGDYWVLGGLENPLEPYRRAVEHYETYEADSTIDERIGQMAEPPFQESTELLRELLAASDVEVGEETQTAIEYRSPVERAEFKVSTMNELIDDVLTGHTWPKS